LKLYNFGNFGIIGRIIFERKLSVIREHCHYISVIISAVIKCFEADLLAVNYSISISVLRAICANFLGIKG